MYVYVSVCQRESSHQHGESFCGARARKRERERECVREREREGAPTRSELPRRTAVSEVSSCVSMLWRVPAVSPWESDRERAVNCPAEGGVSHVTRQA